MVCTQLIGKSLTNYFSIRDSLKWALDCFSTMDNLQWMVPTIWICCSAQRTAASAFIVWRWWLMIHGFSTMDSVQICSFGTVWPAWFWNLLLGSKKTGKTKTVSASLLLLTYSKNVSPTLARWQQWGFFHWLHSSLGNCFSLTKHSWSEYLVSAFNGTG